MNKRGLLTAFAIALILVAITPFTFSLNIKPEIKAHLEPEKVKPGDVMQITAEVKDIFGVKEVTADIQTEKEIETIELKLTEGTNKQGIWSAEWKVHDVETRNYTATIKAKNIFMQQTATLEFSDPTSLILFWDGAADAPADWSCVSCLPGQRFYQRYPRGAATYGGVGGNATHNHTITWGTSSTAEGPDYDDTSGVNPVPNNAHTHTINVYNITTNTSEPPYRTLKIITYPGIPAIIPAGVIAIFNTTDLPSGWTRYFSQDDYFIKGDSTAGTTGGFEVHNHKVGNVTTNTPASTEKSIVKGGHVGENGTIHFHKTTTLTESAEANHKPLYINVTLAKADTDFVGIPNYLIGLFDGATPLGWYSLSGSGEAFNNRFIVGSILNNTVGGASTHTHTDISVSLPEDTQTTASLWDTLPNEVGANDGHTHTVTGTFVSADNLPPFADVIIAMAPINIAPFVGNASLNATRILKDEWVCINATAHDPESDPITVTATVWNTTYRVNYTMIAGGTVGAPWCAGGLGGNVYGVEVQGIMAGTWNFSFAIANDSFGKFNTTIVNLRWNVTALPYFTKIDLDDDFEPTPPDEIDLLAFSSRNVYCNGTATDLEGGSDISVVNATLYDVGGGISSGAEDSNLSHYTNQSCWISTADGNNKHFECLFRVRYFAANSTWQCNATASDSWNYLNSSNVNATINKLVALSIPESINFGTLDAGATSAINKTNVTNAGNIAIDIKIYGYANNVTDSPNSMNCTAGNDKNITLFFTHYNVTDTEGESCTSFGWTSNYWNLTNISNEKTWSNFDLNKQLVEGLLSQKPTCWTLKLPLPAESSISGTCKGIISFTACEDGTCAFLPYIFNFKFFQFPDLRALLDEDVFKPKRRRRKKNAIDLNKIKKFLTSLLDIQHHEQKQNKTQRTTEDIIFDQRNKLKESERVREENFLYSTSMSTNLIDLSHFVIRPEITEKKAELEQCKVEQEQGTERIIKSMIFQPTTMATNMLDPSHIMNATSIFDCVKAGSADVCTLSNVWDTDNIYELMPVRLRAAAAAWINTTNNNGTLPAGATLVKVEVCWEGYSGDPGKVGDDAGDACGVYIGENSTGVKNWYAALGPSAGACLGGGFNGGSVNNDLINCTDVSAFINTVAKAEHTLMSLYAYETTDNNIEFYIDWMWVNVTYSIPENYPPFVGNASVNVTSIPLNNNWVCLNATAFDPESSPITVTATVWNTTYRVNYTMTDTGTTSCDGGISDKIYGVEIQSNVLGTWNFSKAIANDSEGNFNTTIVNRQWNVTNIAPFVGNASLNTTSILKDKWVCLNATAHDPEGNPITVTATVWNTTYRVNYTMIAGGDVGAPWCAGGLGQNTYGIEIQGTWVGTWNFSKAIANDSIGNFNTTIVNLRWNVTAMPYFTKIDLDDDFEPTPPDEIDLLAFSSRNVYCNGTSTDLEGGSDITKINATLYDVNGGITSGSEDNNLSHYTNQSCWISVADGNNKHFECLFRVRYFAANSTWQCNATASDSWNYLNSSNVNATINKLVALSIPDSINFGTLEQGDTSAVNKTNVTNVGNIAIDIKIYGYANNATTSPNAMNCTAGNDKNITLYFTHYNVTDTEGESCTGFGWTSNYWNLTNISNEKTWSNFDLNKQLVEGLLSRKYTCWTLKLPSTLEASLSGTCKGIISFVACEDGTC